MVPRGGWVAEVSVNFRTLLCDADDAGRNLGLAE